MTGDQVLVLRALVEAEGPLSVRDLPLAGLSTAGRFTLVRQLVAKGWVSRRAGLFVAITTDGVEVLRQLNASGEEPRTGLAGGA